MFLTSVEQAEAVADKLQLRFPGRLERSMAMDMVAKMYGYDDWPHMLSSPRLPYSLFDHEIGPEERKERLRQQAAALESFGLSSRAALSYAKFVKPTGRTIDHLAAARAAAWSAADEGA
jgi:hypothetical protein